METFNITLAEHIHLTVTPLHINGKDLVYQLSIGDQVHGRLIPDIDDELGLIWRTEDNIDKLLVDMIGKMIDSHEE